MENMEKINVTKFREKLPQMLKRLNQGVQIQITNRGKPIARLIPEKDNQNAALQRLRKVKGTVIQGDIISPVDSLDWTGDENNL